jgi:UDP-glucose 4-epimerase
VRPVHRFALVDGLLGARHKVLGLDDLSTGRIQNLADALRRRHFRFVEGSILDRSLVDHLGAGVDTIFHLAAAVGVFLIRDRTLDSLRTDVHGTENAAQAPARHGIRFLVASTGEIYGKNTKPGLREDDDRVIGSPLGRGGTTRRARRSRRALSTPTYGNAV